MSSVRLAALFATAATVLYAACGPSAGVDRVDLAGATGGSSGGPGDDAAAGSGGTGPDSNPSPGQGGASGTGGASSNPGTGGGGASGTGGGAATGGASGTGGSGATPDAAEDVITRLEPVLDLSYAAGATSTNLTAAGTLDWMHWALVDASAVNRKRNVTALITAKQLDGTDPGHYDNRPSGMSWSDGTPTRTAADVTDGLVVGDIVDAGFELKVAGVAARPRTLRLHVGGWQVAGQLTASIGSRSYTDTSFRNTSNPGADRIYTIVFQPISDGEFLTVRWTVTDVLQMYGNITVQAATLSE